MKPIFFLLVLCLFGCTKKDNFLGFVYPDKNNLTEHKVIGEYSTLNECLAATNQAAGQAGSYECGKNCDKSKMPMVCDEATGNEK